MNRRLLNKYSVSSLLFIAVAAVLIAIALDTAMGEFVTAAFVIAGMVCAMTGIFILMFSGGEPVDPLLVGLLPAQGCINLCRVASDLGINGNAYFLPDRVTGNTRVMQFNPRSEYTGGTVSAKGSFPETGPEGMVTVPSCDPLIQVLRRRNTLSIPNNEQKLMQLLEEVTGEIFEFSPRVSVRLAGSRVTITFHKYRFIEGCRTIARESKNCCLRNPCPASSLCGALITEATDKVVLLEQCSVSSSNQDVIIIFSVLSSS
ncbi:MAG: hypothetical protein LUQ04_02720 [Methanoregula sp.]|nr:hypothetical protein [Methanoregula sp.]